MEIELYHLHGLFHKTRSWEMQYKLCTNTKGKLKERWGWGGGRVIWTGFWQLNIWRRGLHIFGSTVMRYRMTVEMHL